MSDQVPIAPRRDKLLSAMLTVWASRSAAGVQSGPEAHVTAMIRGAITTGALLTRIDGSTSDGYHTFDELYRHRTLLTAAFFNMAARSLESPGIGALFDVHKSRLHSDGLAPFDDTGWFIVVADLPTGQISYHYRDEDWDLFKIPERARAAEWDGHSAQDAADRLEAFLRG